MNQYDPILVSQRKGQTVFKVTFSAVHKDVITSVNSVVMERIKAETERRKLYKDE